MQIFSLFSRIDFHLECGYEQKKRTMIIVIAGKFERTRKKKGWNLQPNIIRIYLHYMRSLYSVHESELYKQL